MIGAVSSTGGESFAAVTLPGSTAGLYGFGSGTSFSTPEVAGAAALVLAANPLLRATEAAQILKETASNVTLLDRTQRTSAQYRLVRGPRYTFTVAALDGAGSRLASATSSLR